MTKATEAKTADWELNTEFETLYEYASDEPGEYVLCLSAEPSPYYLTRDARVTSSKAVAGIFPTRRAALDLLNTVPMSSRYALYSIRRTG